MSEAAPSPLQSITDHIRHRRSVKPADMDPRRPVERAVLEALLENANQAPTHGMTEPWRFHVLQGPARAELAATMQAVYKEITPASEFREDKYRKMTESAQLAPVIIAIVMARRGGVKIPEIEEIEAVACAVQNLHLSASAAGLAGYWSTPTLVYERVFADWLQLGAEDRCLGLFYLGWPKPGFVWPEGRRSPVQGKIIWHGEATAE